MGKIGDYSKWFPKHNKKTVSKKKMTYEAEKVGDNVAPILFDEVRKVDMHILNIYRRYLVFKTKAHITGLPSVDFCLRVLRKRNISETKF